MLIPDWFVENNAQREINLHNINAIYHLVNPAAFQVFQAYFVVLPIIVSALPTINRWCENVSLPFPDIQVALPFLIGQILFRDLYSPLINYHGLRGKINYGETYELVAELLILLFALRYFSSIRKRYNRNSIEK